jgi:hypothetical protein
MSMTDLDLLPQLLQTLYHPRRDLINLINPQ